MTLRQALDYGKAQLRDEKFTDADTDAWILLEYVTGITRSQYFLKMNEELSVEMWETYQQVIEQRKSHIPVQHITESQVFMGLEFFVNKDVLIPRQDTETLVEEAVKVLEDDMDVLDMCTGSGCIIISLAKMKRIRGTGVDLSKQALDVAKKNGKKLEADITWMESDLFEKVMGTYDFIISNPPYIKTSVIQSLQKEVQEHDPYMALDGRDDGLYFYRKIIQESPKFLKNPGYLYFEIGHDQGNAVKEMMEKAGFQNVCVKKDLAGLDRVVYGAYN